MGERKRNRSRVKIYLDILESIEKEESARLTKIMYSANLPYDRLVKYIDELKTRGFIEEVKDNESRFFVLTEKGKVFIKEIRKIESFLKGFGLSL
ncbi:MAG: hypothetical protein F7B61_01555 [Caldisphaeraceae archaeon]|nr:hypothetical protein [Caldisphaeraceae archaeon]